ncbi:integrase core domain-containing protein [Nocardia asteroides]|nr:integrase core domain-containing protein [Nocardia asteroides]
MPNSDRRSRPIPSHSDPTTNASLPPKRRRPSPQPLRYGAEKISSALQRFCADRVDIVYLPPGTPWNNGHIESFNRRLRSESSTATTGRAARGPGSHRRLRG